MFVCFVICLFVVACLYFCHQFENNFTMKWVDDGARVRNGMANQGADTHPNKI